MRTIQAQRLIELLNCCGQVTQFRIVREVHDTTITEHDMLPETTALLKLVGGPLGNTPQAFIVSGPTDIDVFFEGPTEGVAFDDDRNGLDEVETELAIITGKVPPGCRTGCPVEVLVRPDGTLSLFMVDDLPVSGLTLTELDDLQG